jgi:hypothetical protein
MFHKLTVIIMGSLLLASLSANAQLAPASAGQKQVSPTATSSTVINGQTLTIDYSAPSLEGRKVEGGAIPTGKVWRTGDNTATTLKTPIALKIGTLLVPAGTYTVYSIVTDKGFLLIINKQTGQPGSEYDAAQDLGRTKLNTNDTDGPIERLVIEFENTHGNKTELHIKWGYSESWLHITAQ